MRESHWTPYAMIQNIRLVSGALVTTATSADETTDAIDLLGPYRTAVFTLKITTLSLANASDEADFHFQTSYDGGRTWHALANVHWATAENGTTPTRFVFVSEPATTVTDITPDTTANDDTALTNMPLGGQVRIYLDLTIGDAPSVNYSCSLEVKYAG